MSSTSQDDVFVSQITMSHSQCFKLFDSFHQLPFDQFFRQFRYTWMSTSNLTHGYDVESTTFSMKVHLWDGTSLQGRRRWKISTSFLMSSRPFTLLKDIANLDCQFKPIVSTSVHNATKSRANSFAQHSTMKVFKNL
jgi:hypothetical protein